MKRTGAEYKEQPDHRPHQWFRVRTGVGAALGETKIGTITAISRSGLFFSCFDVSADYEKSRPGPPDATTLSIIHDDGFSLHNLPCKILAENYSPSGNDPGTGNINQYRLQFGTLVPEQQSRLEDFLAHFTDKPLTSHWMSDTSC